MALWPYGLMALVLSTLANMSPLNHPSSALCTKKHNKRKIKGANKKDE